MKTYPNQKVIHIQKRTYEDNFLQVGNDEWQRAARELSGSAFKLYLYLAGNKDGFELALSQKAVEDTTGLSKNTYHRAVEELETKGYLSSTKGNVYVFSPSPSGVSPQNGYMTDAVDAVCAAIDGTQLQEIVNSINSKIRFLCDSKATMIQERINDVLNTMEEMRDNTKSIFDGITQDDLKNLMGAITSNGLDEQKLVQAYIEQAKSKDEQAE